MVRMCIFAVLVALMVAVPLPAQDLQVSYDREARVWTLQNQLIQAQYILDPNGLFFLRSLAGPGGKNWISGGSEVSGPIHFAIDDSSLENAAWELADTHSERAARGGQRQVIRLRNTDLAVEVVVQLEIHPNQPFLHVRYGYHNLDGVPHVLADGLYVYAHFNPEQLGIRAFSVDQFRNGVSPFATSERNLADQPSRMVTVVGGANAQHCTWLALRDDADNGLVVGWEFDGRGYLNAVLSGAGDDLFVFGGPMSLHAPVPAGGMLQLPGAFVGLYQGDWDEAAFRTDRYVEAVLAAPPPSPDFPYVAYDTWGYGQNINETTLRSAAAIAARTGVELFIVDLGWARAIGDWQEDRAKFPGGLKAFGDYVHSLGMKFGLHFVPAQATLDSPVVQANPDWLSSVNNDYFGAASLCLSHQPAQEWIRQSARNLVEGYGVDWITQDGENMVKECFAENHTHDPQNSNWSNSRQGIDALVQYMRAEYPAVLWENNADGGTMLTFKAVQNYATFGSCDACYSEDRRKSVWGMSYVFPPRFIDRYDLDLPTQLTTRSSMLGGP